MHIFSDKNKKKFKHDPVINLIELLKDIPRISPSKD